MSNRRRERDSLRAACQEQLRQYTSAGERDGGGYLTSRGQSFLASILATRHLPPVGNPSPLQRWRLLLAAAPTPGVYRAHARREQRQPLPAVRSCPSRRRQYRWRLHYLFAWSSSLTHQPKLNLNTIRPTSVRMSDVGWKTLRHRISPCNIKMTMNLILRWKIPAPI